MLTPEFLLRIVEATEEKTAELNNYVAERIAKRIMALFSREGGTDSLFCTGCKKGKGNRETDRGSEPDR